MDVASEYNDEMRGEMLSFETHLGLDPRCTGKVWTNFDGTHFSPEDFVSQCLEPALSVQIPVEVNKLFERAKAIMSFGIYHYPLFTAGESYNHMTKEAALYHFSVMNGFSGDRDRATMGKLIQFCEKESLLNSWQLKKWINARDLRNMTLHQKRPSLQLPNIAISSLHHTRRLIDNLFVFGPPNFLFEHLTELRLKHELERWDRIRNDPT